MRQYFRLNSTELCLTSNCLKSVLQYGPFSQRFQCSGCNIGYSNVKHLICFKQWTPKMVTDVVCSAIHLKNLLRDTHLQKLDVIRNAKVMILQEVNEPLLKMAVSKAASLLGADDVEITEPMMWDQDYHGRIFSEMSDLIFVSTRTHACLRRFAEKSMVPVLCMYSRTHAPIQALATIMTIVQEFGPLRRLNIAYVGPPHPVLNSYLLLFPMLGANIKFKCCCQECPVSPLLLDACKSLTKTTFTIAEQCTGCCEALEDASVIIAGPTAQKKEKIPEYQLSVQEINSKTKFSWIFIHTCPRGEELEDKLFYHRNARTFTVFQNLHYIAAALMTYHMKNYMF